MNLAWRAYPLQLDASARGYLQSAYFLWDGLHRWLGKNVVDVGGDGGHPKVHLHYCPPHHFRPVPGKLNVLMTMWEASVLPPDILANIKRADVHLVPSTWCQSVWSKHGLTARVVPLGVPAAFVAGDRARQLVFTPERVLRYLWVGTKSKRKGWQILTPAWRIAFEGARRASDVELYVKMVGDGTVGRWINPRLVIDQRALDPVDMLALYRSADVFVFPTLGEGFGLTALEAMAAGCLVLAPPTGGMTEFVSAQTAVLVPQDGSIEVEYGGVKTNVPAATPEALAERMRMVRDNWGSPTLESIRVAGMEAASALTWDDTVRVLCETLDEVLQIPRLSGNVPRGTSPATVLTFNRLS